MELTKLTKEVIELTKLTKEEIASWKLDCLTTSPLRNVTINIGDYEYFVKGYFLGAGFEVESVSRYDNGNLRKYGEPHRRMIQDYYERELVEACL